MHHEDDTGPAADAALTIHSSSKRDRMRNIILSVRMVAVGATLMFGTATPSAAQSADDAELATEWLLVGSGLCSALDVMNLLPADAGAELDADLE